MKLTLLGRMERIQLAAVQVAEGLVVMTTLSYWCPTWVGKLAAKFLRKASRDRKPRWHR